MADESVVERWLPIRRFNGLYEISSLGRVKSIRRGIILKAALDKQTGYYRVAPRMYGRQFNCSVHRLMAFEFLGCTDDQEVDHKNLIRSDNRLENLRLATHQQNQFNRSITASNTSGYKGAHKCYRKNRWRSRIKIGDKHKHLGYFNSPEEAHAAYLAEAKKHHGEFAGA